MERYNKIKPIGSGTFGQAWLVESTISQRNYALKELGVTAMSEQDRHLALNEAKILSQLKHKNIVRYKEAFVAEGKLCIAMEFAENGDLYTRIRERNGSHFTEMQILEWFTQLCLALKYIHGQNILHRDLKTQNIFLGKDDIIKLGDFGIARMLNSTLDHAQTTVGTPYYLSPEICQRKPYNHKSDMWSLGCVLYEMATLKHAFNANNFSALVIKILQGQYPPVPRCYGPLVEDLVSTLLQKNPDGRPSAKQLLYVPAMQPYVKKFLLCERDRTDSVASDIADISSRTRSDCSQISASERKESANDYIKTAGSVADSSTTSKKAGDAEPSSSTFEGVAGESSSRKRIISSNNASKPQEIVRTSDNTPNAWQNIPASHNAPEIQRNVRTTERAPKAQQNFPATGNILKARENFPATENTPQRRENLRSSDHALKARENVPTSGNMLKARENVATSGNILKARENVATSGNMLKARENVPTSGNMLKARENVPTSGNMLKARENVPTSGNMLKARENVPTSGNIPKARENVSARCSVRTRKQSLVAMAHAQQRRYSEQNSACSERGSRIHKSRIRSQGAQCREFTESDDVFAKSQATVIPARRTVDANNVANKREVEQHVENASSSCRNKLTSMAEQRRQKPALSVCQPTCTEDMRTRKRHQSAATVVDRNLCPSEQKHRRLTYRPENNGKDKENRSSLITHAQVSAKRRVSSSALKQIQTSNLEKQQTVKPGSGATGNEGENRKRTYTVSHERKLSEFEIPEVDETERGNEESGSCGSESGICKDTNGREAVCVSHGEKSRLADKSAKDEKLFIPQSGNQINSNEQKCENIVQLNSKTTNSKTEKQSSAQTPCCKFTFCGKTLRLDNVSAHDSVYSHMEALRMHLEKKLGTRLLTAVYRYVTNASHDEHERITQTVLCMLGEDNMTYFPVLLQLMACEAMYFH